jgi:adenylate cyclase
MKDLFELQDEITMKILTELQVKITAGEAARIYAKGTNNLQAYLRVLEADWFRLQNNKEANAMAIRLSHEAVELDPNYPMAHRALALTLLNDALFGASKSPEETLSNAMKSAQKAVELDSSGAVVYATLGAVFLWMRQHDKAIDVAERAVALDPNSPTALHVLAMCLNYSFRSEEALPLERQAVRLNPFSTPIYHHFGIACRETGRYEEGISALKKSLQIAPTDVIARVVLVSLYMYAGREDDARATVAEIQRIDPNLSVTRFARWSPWKEGPRRDRFIDSLRQAGLT